jgi:hypothetical protein
MPLLLIGIHKDELEFGDRVALSLGDQMDVLRVEKGLNGANPTPDGLFHYSIRHAEMYHQVLQSVARKQGPVIDLHTGLNKDTRCADVYCHSERFLRCLEQEIALGRGRLAGPEDVRLIRIVAHDAARGGKRLGAIAGARPVVWTYIPETVWRNPRFLYVGIEVFLPAPGAGNAEDHQFASALVRLAADCAMRIAGKEHSASTPA